MSGLAIWFCRLMGPLLLATLAAEWLPGLRASAIYPYVAGLVYLVAWVGGYLVWIEGRRGHAKFALPIALFALSICVMAVATLAPVTAETRALLGDAARVLHGLAGLAFALLGWTTRIHAED